MLRSSKALLRFEIFFSRLPTHFAPAAKIRRISRRIECPNSSPLLHKQIIIKNVLLNATSSEGPIKAIKNKVQQTQTGPPIPPNDWGNFGPKGTPPPKHAFGNEASPILQASDLSPWQSRSAKRLIVALTASPSTA